MLCVAVDDCGAAVGAEAEAVVAAVAEAGPVGAAVLVETEGEKRGFDGHIYICLTLLNITNNYKKF